MRAKKENSTMNIAYCSLLLPEEKKLSERTKERLSGISLHKLSTAVISGIEHNTDKPVSIFNIINTLNYPKFPQIIFKTENWSHVNGGKDWHIGYVNLIGIKYLTQAWNQYRKLDAWIKEHSGERCLICVHHIYYPSMLAATMIKKRYGERVITCLMTGDMNGKYGLVSQFKPNLKQRMLHFVENCIDTMAQKFDCFIFVTKEMAKGFHVEKKPFVVMECTYTAPIYISERESLNLTGAEERIIFYAGALREEYGVIHLLRAFSLIKDNRYRLWLAGGGAAESRIREFADRDRRIEFLGFITPQEVDRRQKAATVLISPRTAQYEFVKYSFPSKTMECLASGKPYIAHRLPCDPPEYGDYIQYADNETDEGLCKKIIEICELPQRERDVLGKRAQRFIQSEKNPNVMCKCIVEMWQRMVEI